MNTVRDLCHKSTFSISDEARRLHDLVDLGTDCNDDNRIGNMTEKDQIRKNMIQNMDRMLQSDRVSINQLRSADAMFEKYVSDTFQEMNKKNGSTVTKEYEFGCEDTSGTKNRKRNFMSLDL